MCGFWFVLRLSYVTKILHSTPKLFKYFKDSKMKYFFPRIFPQAIFFLTDITSSVLSPWWNKTKFISIIPKMLDLWIDGSWFKRLTADFSLSYLSRKIDNTLFFDEVSEEKMNMTWFLNTSVSLIRQVVHKVSPHLLNRLLPTVPFLLPWSGDVGGSGATQASF